MDTYFKCKVVVGQIVYLVGEIVYLPLVFVSGSHFSFYFSSAWRIDKKIYGTAGIKSVQVNTN